MFIYRISIISLIWAVVSTMHACTQLLIVVRVIKIRKCVLETKLLTQKNIWFSIDWYVLSLYYCSCIAHLYIYIESAFISLIWAVVSTIHTYMHACSCWLWSTQYPCQWDGWIQPHRLSLLGQLQLCVWVWALPTHRSCESVWGKWTVEWTRSSLQQWANHPYIVAILQCMVFIIKNLPIVIPKAIAY